MRTLIDYFIKRPLIVNALSIIILLFGSIALWGLQKEVFPKIEFDVVILRTAYLGATPEDVEKLVTVPIERRIKSIEGIRKLHGISQESLSIVYLELEPEADLATTMQDVRDAVNQITDFPEDVEKPIVKTITSVMRGAIKVAVYEEDYPKLKAIAKKLRDELEREEDIGAVNIGGYIPDEIAVMVDVNKLNKYELTISEITAAIKDRNLNLSAGSIPSDDREILIRTLAEYKDVEDIKKIVVRSNATGQKILLSDVANVSRRLNSSTTNERYEAKPAIFLEVSVKESSDLVESADKVKKLTKEFFETNPQIGKAKYAFVDDMSYYVTRRLNILKSNGLMGLFLVFGSLLMFLNFRISAVTSFGAPVAFLLTFVSMSLFGISLNMMSMFALILVLGMLMDDSIIVAEQFYQYLEKGVAPRVAARRAAVETIKPILATVLTTMIAFGALFFLGGIMGKFLWQVPVIVIIALAGSLFECFFILPSHLADFVRVDSKAQSQSRWYKFMHDGYGKVLKVILRNPAKTIGVFLFAFLLSIFLATKTRFQMFPGDDVRMISMTLKGGMGIERALTDSKTLAIEKMMLKTLQKNEYESIRSSVGQAAESFGAKLGDQYSTIYLYLTAPDQRSRDTDQILNDILARAKTIAPDFVINANKMKGGPPQGKPISIELTTDDLPTLIAAAHDVESIVKKINGVTTSEIDYEDGKDQIIISVRDEEAKRLGLSTTQIALEVRKAFAKDSITQIREVDEDIDIIIDVKDGELVSKSTILGKLFIQNNKGSRIPLLKVVSLVKSASPYAIRRLDGKRIISVSGDIDNNKTSPMRAVKEIEPHLKEMLEKKYPDINYTFAGENEDTKDSMTRLAKSAIIAFVSIFFILLVMFSSVGQPLIIMSAIPFGLMNVIFIFFVFQMSLSFMAFLGVVALIGVVVNDSIVLVHSINTMRDDHASLTNAIFEASVSRLRPVLLTTFTTVAGLVPLAHDPSGDPFLKPMAISFAYGLLFATGVTLILIPSLYLMYDKFISYCRKSWLMKVINAISPNVE